jgi:cell division protease FtsH
VNGSYSLLQPYGEPGGYQAGAGYPSGVSADYPHANGSPSGGYLPPAGDNSGFGSDTSSGSYQSPPPAPDSYRPDFGAASYQGGAGYGMRGYDPLTSPSLPPGPASYGNGAADQAGGYPGYGGQTPRSGSHRRPEPGYPDGSYQGHNGYDSGGPQPGYGASDYQASSYDHQAGYPLPPHEEDGYQGTDPYAADPYGQHGYGGNGY